jgi:hypothetical protein
MGSENAATSVSRALYLRSLALCQPKHRRVGIGVAVVVRQTQEWHSGAAETGVARMRQRDGGRICRRTVLTGILFGGVATLDPGRGASGAATGRLALGLSSVGLAAAAGLEAAAAAAGAALPGFMTDPSHPVTVIGPGWHAAAEAVADDAVALGLVLRAADDPAPWPGGAALEAASQSFVAPLALWSTVPLADRAAFDGLAVGVAGAGGLGLTALGVRPVPLAAAALAPALRDGRIAAAAPPPGIAGTALGLHRTAPYLVVAAEPPPPLRLCWLIAPGLATALSPFAQQTLDAALRAGLAAALGSLAGSAHQPGTGEAAARGVRRTVLSPALTRAHAGALRALAAPGLDVA